MRKTYQLSKPSRRQLIKVAGVLAAGLAAPSVLRAGAGPGMLLERDIAAAAATLGDAVDELNSLLAVEGALGRLPAVELLTAFETVMREAKRLRTAITGDAEPAQRPLRRVAELLNAAQG